jgi:hypothetical protein
MPLFVVLFGWGANRGRSFRRRLRELLPERGIAMYCAKCRRQLYYKDPENHGWCFGCGEICSIENCKIPYWSLMAVFTMLWTLQV